MSLLIRMYDMTNYLNYTFIFSDTDIENFRQKYNKNVKEEMKDPRKLLDVFVSEVLPKFFELKEEEKNNVENPIVKTTIDCMVKYVFSFEDKVGIVVDSIEIFRLTENEYHIHVNNRATLRA